ncbi:hypothetical protein RF11_04646 [Thelohanellus kitauei]|uniref:Uncharacterized protein n=1 Tax=Thelohanellus kitauei TaxID=669202 RepID=A0A0C2JY13_THEKT|nr:hypothetical protein RF11_04646 [Thelohanellus kitauei]
MKFDFLKFQGLSQQNVELDLKNNGNNRERKYKRDINAGDAWSQKKPLIHKIKVYGNIVGWKLTIETKVYDKEPFIPWTSDFIEKVFLTSYQVKQLGKLWNYTYEKDVIKPLWNQLINFLVDGIINTA